MASVLAASVMHIVSHVEHRLLHTRFAVVLAQNKSLPAGAKPASPAVGCLKPTHTRAQPNLLVLAAQITEQSTEGENKC